jgi:hypothetical protein
MSKILSIIKDNMSTTFYYDENKNLHRENGPAVESKQGNKWYIHGQEVEPSQKMIQQYNDYISYIHMNKHSCSDCSEHN